MTGFSVRFRSYISVTLSSGVYSLDAINKIETERDSNGPCPDERLPSRGSKSPEGCVASNSATPEFRGGETQRQINNNDNDGDLP